MLIHLDDPAGMEVTARLCLEGEFTDDSSLTVKESLMKAMERHAAILIDCSAVTRIDLPAVRLLCAAHRTAQALGRSLSLSGLRHEVLSRALQSESPCRPQLCPGLLAASEFCLLDCAEED